MKLNYENRKPMPVKPGNFRWDLFLRDYRAFMHRKIKTNKEIGYEWGVNNCVLSGLMSGRLDRVGIKTLNKILKGMNLYYAFYCED